MADPLTGNLPMIPPNRREKSGFLRRLLSLACSIALGWWNFPITAVPQVHPLFQESTARDTALLPRVVTEDGREAQLPLLDSLTMQTVEIEIQQAQLEVDQTDFFHRLVPQVHLSGSIGITDVLFMDPATTALSILPRDAYRLNFTLSLSDLVDNSRHRSAELRLERLRADFARIRLRLEETRSDLQRELAGLYAAAALDSAELSMKEEVLRYNSLRFEHGKIDFSLLTRSRLDVLNLKKRMVQSGRHMNTILIKLQRRLDP